MISTRRYTTGRPKARQQGAALVVGLVLLLILTLLAHSWWRLAVSLRTPPAVAADRA